MDVKKAMLNIGEETVKQVWTEVLKPLMIEMAQNSDNKIDDLFIPFAGQVDAVLMPMIDMIDGEAG